MTYAYKLPYEFDLFYDVKSMKDIEIIAAGQPSRCNVSIKELVDLFIAHEMPIPGCLLKSKQVE